MGNQRRLRDPFDGNERPVERPDLDGESEIEPGLAGALTDLSSSNMVGAHQRALEPLEEPATSASLVHDAAPEQETVFGTSVVDPSDPIDQVGAAVTQSFSDVSGLGEVSHHDVGPADELAVDDIDGLG